MSFDEELQMENRKKVVEVAKSIISGTTGIIEGARVLSWLRFKVSEEDLDPDFIIFVVIDSDTDHLPLGSVRKEWAPDSLAKKDLEIKDAEEFYRNDALAACKKLIQRFSEAA